MHEGQPDCQKRIYSVFAQIVLHLSFKSFNLFIELFVMIIFIFIKINSALIGLK